MRFNNKLVLCLILLCLFVCCLGVASAADISVSDMHDIGDGDFVVTNDVGHVSIGDSGLNHDDGQFNDFVSLDNHKSSNYDNHIVGGSTNGAGGVSGVSDGDQKSSKYNGRIVDGSGNSTDGGSGKSDFVRCVVSCEDDFKNVSNQFRNLTNSTGVIVDIVKDIDINNKGSVLDFDCKNKTMIIIGNGFKVNMVKPDLRAENHFLNCGNSSCVLMAGLKFGGFNTAVNNYGKCVFENVTFDGNKLKYYRDWDDGGAIKNFGELDCYNCSFLNNYAMYGGAIYTNGTFSKLKLSDCIFKDNAAYASESGDNWFQRIMKPFSNFVDGYKKFAVLERNGNDVFVGGDGLVSVYNLNSWSTPYSSIHFGYDDSKPTFVSRTSYDPVIREFVVNDTNSLKNASESIWNSHGDVDIFVVNMTNNVSFNSWGKDMHVFHPNYGLLIINGNGYSVNLLGAKENDEYHFAFVNKTSLVVNNLKISGFNCAIMNQGVSVFNNVSFVDNKVKFSVLSGDEAGAINNLGLLTCVNCTFQQNKGNWAGAIYNAHGAVVNLNNCTFADNIQCKGSDGGDLYNYNNAKYVIDGKVISKDSNLTGVSIAYGYLPSGWKKVGYYMAEVGSYLLSFAAGFTGAVLTGGPGAVVGVVVGTVLGTAIDLGCDAWYYNSMHSFSGFDARTIVISVGGHFISSVAGGAIGTSIYDASVAELVRKFPNLFDLNEYKLPNPSSGSVENLIV